MEKNNTKRKILNAALDLFSTQGFDATSMSQIAKAVGVRKASPYSHYGEVVYEGNGKAATDFSLRVAESGVYKMEVIARRAKGIIAVKAINRRERSLWKKTHLKS